MLKDREYYNNFFDHFSSSSRFSPIYEDTNGYIVAEIRYDFGYVAESYYKICTMDEICALISEGAPLNLDGCYIKDFNYPRIQQECGNDTILHGFSANRAFFDGYTNFTNAIFEVGEKDFRNTRFGKGLIDFSNAQFNEGDVRFDETYFEAEKLNFSEVNFGKGIVSFELAKFEPRDIFFKDAKFGKGEVSFYGAQLCEAHSGFLTEEFGRKRISFRGAEFGEGYVDFSEMDFDEWGVDFSETKFGTEGVSFKGAWFGGWCYFDRAQFGAGDVSFDGAEFDSKYVSFYDTEFGEGDVSFYLVEFGAAVVSFDGAEFGEGDVSFDGAKFAEGDVSFEGTEFGEGDVSFEGAEFAEGKVSFEGAGFGEGDVSFEGAEFAEGKVSFEGAEFSEGHVSFEGAKFAAGKVSFEQANLSHSKLDFSHINAPDASLLFRKCELLQHDNLRVSALGKLEIIDCVLEHTLLIDSVQGYSVNISSLSFNGTKNEGTVYLDWETARNGIHSYDRAELIKHMQRFFKIYSRWMQTKSTSYHHILKLKICKKLLFLKKRRRSLMPFYKQQSEQFQMLKENFHKIGKYDHEDEAFVEYMRSYRQTQSTPMCVGLWLLDVIGEYGTKPRRLSCWMGGMVLGFAAIYGLLIIWQENSEGGDFFSIGKALAHESIPDFLEHFIHGFYISAITFLTIGDNDIASRHFFSATLITAEGFFGLFLMSYFIVSLVRKTLR